MMSRNLEKELSYWVYNDPEYGDDIINLDYPSLIGLLTELLERIGKLEEWKEKAQKSARIVKQTLDAKND